MIRLATYTDIPYIVEGMVALKVRTGWACYLTDGYTHENLQQFVKDRLSDSQSILYISEPTAGSLQGFCGASLNQFYLPPYMPLLFEWGWFGSPKEAARCWRASVQWGLKRGVQLVGRVHVSKGTRPSKIIEQQVWKVVA